jgi:hypothetical protein
MTIEPLLNSNNATDIPHGLCAGIIGDRELAGR